MMLLVERDHDIRVPGADQARESDAENGESESRCDLVGRKTERQDTKHGAKRGAAEDAAERADRDCVLASMHIVRRLVAAPALAWLKAEEFAPGPRVNSDEELLDFVTRTAETTYHPVGTCRMGGDPLAVVDDQLRVHGIAGLRVADASIMPTLTSGNTNAPSIMIGEKAARMALQAAA